MPKIRTRCCSIKDLFTRDIFKPFNEAEKLWKITDPKTNRSVEIANSDRHRAVELGEQALGIPPFTGTIEELEWDDEKTPTEKILDEF